MGGDHGPDTVVPAALATLERDDSVSLALVGLADVLERVKRQAGDRYGSRLQFKAATEVVSMDEPPADALRRKKDSSLRVAIELVKSGEADACVSSGNTGALMATARYVLKTLPGIDRPAIISAVPGIQSPTFMLDLGANVGCTPEHLLQFALMGSVVAEDMLVMASIEASESGPTGGRLVVSRDEDRLALFTGELAGSEEPWRVHRAGAPSGTNT